MTTGIRRKRRGHAWLALAGYLVLTLGLTYPLVTQFGRAIPGDGFDGWQNYWNLWWIRTALLEQHTHPWFTNMLYYPTGVGLLFHTLNAFNGFLFLPIQLVFGLLPAYNAVVLFSFTLGGLGAYLLFFGTCFVVAWRTVQGTQGYWRAVALGALGILVHLAVHNLFDNLLVHSMNVQLGLVLGLLYVGAKGAPQSTQRAQLSKASAGEHAHRD